MKMIKMVYSMLLKHIIKIPVLIVACIFSIIAFAQHDTSKVQNLKKVVVIGYKTMNGIGHLNEAMPPFLFIGKKTEVIIVDSVDANKAINNTRQILGRIPGLNIVESETGGFVANGIGIRGLNPVQSLELNMRQNGYNVAADVYGYNETYYLPPMEAVERVEMVKGAASLQFGSQIGGMVNYRLKDGNAEKPFTYSSMQTVGSGGLFNSYHALGGTVKKINYFSFVNYRTLTGWRANSNQQQLTGFGKLKYQASGNLSLNVEYSILRNKIKMPGGLTDGQFEESSTTSVRSRNWLQIPWYVVSANLEKKFGERTSFHVVTTFLSGNRSLVWVNALPEVADRPDPVSGAYDNREVDKEMMKSSATEIRLSHQYQIGKFKNTLSTGTRLSYAHFRRMEEAPGSNKNDFDLTPLGEYEEEFTFKTLNVATFMENNIHINDRLSISPGFRFETMETEAEAEVEKAGVETELEHEKERQFVLMGIGAQYQAGKHATTYVNVTQSYRPIDYAQLLPLGSVSKVDPEMKDPKGWNADIGVRGTIRQYFNYDISLFYLTYKDRIGTVLKQDDDGTMYGYRTNLDESIHKGIETYLELNITRALEMSNRVGNLSVSISSSYIDARYSKGEYRKNQVEYAPRWINRIGISYVRKWFSSSLQFSQQSKAFADASNTVRSTNPIVGEIPGYQVIDWSITVHWNKLKFKAGLCNLTDQRYFTQRADEYPGPGLIPSIQRSFYLGIGWDLF